MKLLFFITIFSLLIFISPAFALNITLSTDKSRVLLGESFTLSGKITNDDGTSGVFDYRAAVVAPKRIVICDSNKTKTSADCSFSLTCKTPTKEEANSLGIPAALERAVIPLKPGVAVHDSATNKTVKKHARAILAVNPDKFKAKINNISTDVDNFIKRTNEILSQCDKLIERAQRFNVTNVVEKCQTLKEKLDLIIQDLRSISTKAAQLKDNINAADLEDFKDELSVIKDDMKELRDELKDMRTLVKSIRWETLKEIRKVVKEELEEKREKIKEEIKSKREELKERIKQTRNKTEGSR